MSDLPFSPGNDDPLRAPLTALGGLSPHRLDLFARLGLRTVGDLLYHLPRAYEDLTDVRAIAKLSADTAQTVRGEVVEIDGRRLADGRSVVSVVLSDDGKHCLEGVWFNQPFAASRFRYGQWVAFSGKPKWYRDHWHMSSPRVQVLAGPSEPAETEVVPIYPMTEDLRPEHLRRVIGQALERFGDRVVDLLPEAIRQKHGWPLLPRVLRDLHFPPSLEAATRARRRVIYEEFLTLQIGLALRRREVRDRRKAPVLTTTPLIDQRVRRLFPFQLTADQDKAVADVCGDLASDRPMQRLLQADVGAGKTAVAVYALLVAVANKHQAALMAPTEVLARQHARTLDRYLAHSRVRRLLLTGGLSARERRAALESLRKGEVDLVVGTQALVQEDVEFAQLGLVIIDEQHRFGVEQRAAFRRLGVDPHYLVMTATPIPRTLALTVFGDLDVSVMRQLPPGRQPVQTRWETEARRSAVYEQVRRMLTEKRQAYVVCPLVEESLVLDVKAATAVHAELSEGPFRDFRVGLLHGRQDDDEKASVMERFAAGGLDVLVCTTVVEVGIDVANATVMVIEHAERFGLAQLHQLRGRVSRGPVAGRCFLFAEAGSPDSKERLKTFVRTTDGFTLAEADVGLRGTGEFFGSRQHGLGELRWGDLANDTEILRLARSDAFRVVGDDPGLQRPEHERLRQVVLRRWGKTLDLAEIG